MSKNTETSVFVGGCLTIITLFAAMALFGGMLFVFLWNITVPQVFGGPALEWYHGVAIVAMARLLIPQAVVNQTS